MAKRGRKPGETAKKGYFYEKQEQAVLDYLHTNDAEEKNKIYKEILEPAYKKMVESIIRRYRYYIPNEDSGATFNDTLSFLITKMDKYKPIITTYKKATKKDREDIDEEFITSMDECEYYSMLTDVIDDESPQFIKVFFTQPDGTEKVDYFTKIKKKYKAYSYYGTICRNYLIGRIQSYAKSLERNPSYDSIAETFVDNIKYSDAQTRASETAKEVMSGLARQIGRMIEEPKAYDLKENELKVGRALKNLFENWEYVLTTDGSNKLNKNAVLLFLRETTGLDTKGVRDNMKKFRKQFLLIKSDVIN